MGKRRFIRCLNPLTTSDRITMNLRRYTLIMLVCFCAFTSLVVQAQTKLVILDEQLKPVDGAVVFSAQLGIEAVTDVNGKVEVAIDEATLVEISHVAHITKSMVLFPNKRYSVVLSHQVLSLDDAVVEGFSANNTLREQAGGIEKLSKQSLVRFGETSPVDPISLLPGITFEERAAASYRISIRGSSLRSPFGIRNVKVYWNGMPFTGPGGNTYLNLFDMDNLSGLEVIKGPSASMYGAGTGGVMKFNSTDYASLANTTRFGALWGAYGESRYSIQHNTTGEKFSITAKFANQKTDGYRVQNFMDRSAFELNGLYFPSDKQTISADIAYTDLYYGIPGGLNKDQYDENPQQARPGSVLQNASIDHKMLLVNLGHEYEFSEKLSNTTNLFLTNRDFENPFILDYKRDEETRYGFRTQFDHRLDEAGQFNLNYGWELQRADYDGKNFGNVSGHADTIRFADEMTNTESMFFLNGSYKPTDFWTVSAGASLHSLTYDIDRTIDEINNNPQRLKKQFDNVFSPRVSVSRLFNNGMNAHFSISNGFSAPTTSEVRTNEGSLNEDLEAEKGTNYELNFRGPIGLKGLSFDLSLFHFDLDQSITTYTDPNGVVLFRNAGSLKQNGLELQVLKKWFFGEESFFDQITSTLAYTHHNFEFGDYTSGGDDFSGNDLTGTAPNVLGFSTDVAFANRFYVNTSYQYTDEIPLNDANSVYSDGFHQLNTKLGYDVEAAGKIGLSVFIGVNNLLDEKYSLGNDLNAFGGRYYQPAPDRNFYFGLKLNLRK